MKCTFCIFKNNSDFYSGFTCISFHYSNQEYLETLKKNIGDKQKSESEFLQASNRSKAVLCSIKLTIADLIQKLLEIDISQDLIEGEINENTPNNVLLEVNIFRCSVSLFFHFLIWNSFKNWFDIFLFCTCNSFWKTNWKRDSFWSETTLAMKIVVWKLIPTQSKTMKTSTSAKLIPTNYTLIWRSFSVFSSFLIFKSYRINRKYVLVAGVATDLVNKSNTQINMQHRCSWNWKRGHRQTDTISDVLCWLTGRSYHWCINILNIAWTNGSTRFFFHF